LPRVEFFEGPPRKYLVDGVETPSVTQVLGVLDKSGPLMWWAWQLGIQDFCELAAEDGELPDISDWRNVEAWLKAAKRTPNHRRDKAADRGKDVHDALEAYMRDGIVPALADFPESQHGYVQALAKWLFEYQPEFVKAEVVVGSRIYGYAGRYDLLCRLSDDFGGQLLRVDLKTGKRIYDNAFIQLAAYEEAAIECGEEPSDDQYVLRVGPDGEYQFTKSCATFEDFRCVLACYQALQRVKAARKQKVVA
jgi:hypothetical protein